MEEQILPIDFNDRRITNNKEFSKTCIIIPVFDKYFQRSKEKEPKTLDYVAKGITYDFYLVKI